MMVMDGEDWMTRITKTEFEKHALNFQDAPTFK